MSTIHLNDEAPFEADPVPPTHRPGLRYDSHVSQ